MKQELCTRCGDAADPDWTLETLDGPDFPACRECYWIVQVYMIENGVGG